MQVYSRLNPFTSETKHMVVPEGVTISDIMDFAGVGKRLRKYCKVTVAGHEVSPEKWRVVKPKDKSDIRIYATPQGGGGGGKAVLGAVLVVAAIVLMQPAVAGAISNSLAGALTVGTGEFGGAVLLGGITGAGLTSAVGYAAIGLAVVGLSMIAQSFAPKLPSFSLGGLNGATTSNTYKITGSSNKSNPYGVIPKVYGKHKVYPLVCANTFTEQAGDDEYLNMLLTFGTGPVTISDLKIGQNPIEWYEDVEYEYRPGRDDDAPLTLYKNSVLQDNFSLEVTQSSAKTARTRVDANEFSFDVSFPQGLAYYNSSGGTDSSSVTLRYEYKEVSASTWTLISEDEITDNATSSFTVSKRVVVPSVGQYDVRVTRLTEDSESIRTINRTVFTVLRTFKYVDPINEPNLSKLALRIKATDQLNGVIDDLNAIAYGEVRAWNGSSLDDYAHSRNPAWAYLDVLIGLSSKKQVALSRIDLDRLLEWAEECDELDSEGNPMYQFDAVIDYETTAFELLNTISTSARASYGSRAGKYSIVRDKKQTITRDIYTPRNTNGFKGTKVMLEMPHAIRARFVSPEKDYTQDEVTIYADGYNSSNATKFEEVEWFGVTTYAQVYRLTRYFLACILLRPKSFSFNTSIDGFVIERGDMVEVAHDVPLLGGTPALVKRVIKSGADITHYILDDYVTMESGKTYGLRLRDLEGNTVTHEVITTVGETDTLELVTPEPETTVSKLQSIVAFGEYSTETTQMIVQKIERMENLTAKVTLLPYNDAIYNSETEVIPEYDPKINYQGNEYVPTKVQKLIVTQRAIGGAKYNIQLDLSWQPPQEGGSFTYEIYRYTRGQYRLQDVIRTTSWSSPDEVAIGSVERFAVVAVSSSGRKLPISQANSKAVAVTPVPVPNVDRFSADVVGDNIILSWGLSNDAYIYEYEIKHSVAQESALWGASVTLHFVASPTKTITLPVRKGTYLIKARDYLGNESSQALTVINNVVGSSQINVIQTITESPTYGGEKKFVGVVDDELRLIPDAQIDDVEEIDSISNFDELDGPVASFGTYYFEDTFDLGNVYTSRITSVIDVYGVSYNDIIDNFPDVDSRNDWDGGIPSQYGVNLLIRTTNDDPSVSPVWGEWETFVASEYTARAFQFKVELISTSANVTPSITELSVTIDMPDRFERGSDIASGFTTKQVTYSAPFWNASGNPTVAVTANDMGTGDYFTITNKTNSGFDITFYNNNDVIISREFDYVSAGYGREN